MDKEKNGDGLEIDIVDCIRAVLKRWYIILGAAACGVILAFVFFVQGHQQEYSATIKLYVNNNNDSSSSSWSQSDITASRSLVQEYLVVLESRPTLDKACEIVNEKYDYGLTYDTIRKKISGGAIEETTVFQVTVTDTSPERAVNIANSIANSFPEEVEKIFDKSSARVIEDALEAKAIDAGHVRKLIVGAFLGIIFACVYAIVSGVLINDAITSNEWLQNKYENKLPVLGEIPDMNSLNSGKRYGRYGRYGGYNSYVNK